MEKLFRNYIIFNIFNMMDSRKGYLYIFTISYISDLFIMSRLFLLGKKALRHLKVPI